jgi:lipopolysaccharide transport system ATP-binding protein
VKFHGPTPACVDLYRREFMETTEVALAGRTDRVGDGSIRFTDAWVENRDGDRGQAIASGDTLRIVARFRSSRDSIRSLQAAFALYTSDGTQITDLWSKSVGCEWDDVPDAGSLVCTIPRIPLSAGKYRFNVYAKAGNATADGVEGAGFFEIVEADFFGSGVLPGRDGGSVLIDQHWDLEV